MRYSCFMVAVLFGNAYGSTLHVPSEYASIQDAINAAVHFDVIEVAPGLYNERIHYQSKLLTITSSDPDDPSVVEATILKYAGSSTVDFSGTEDERASLVGFTILGNMVGGGLAIRGNGCRAIIDRCHITRNGSGGIASVHGRITRCMISESNKGIWDCNARIDRCYISDNSNYGIEGGDGAHISNSVFSGNGWGWGYGSNTVIRNCTFVGNKRGISGGHPGNVVQNCIVWENELSQIDSFASDSAIIEYCNIQDRAGGTGNISSLPLFVTPGYWSGGSWVEGDYSLLSFSPCVGTGDPDFDSEEQDFIGSPRVIGRVDIGALEYQDCSGSDFDEDGEPDVCDADIDNDGVLNAVDICDYTPVGVVVDDNGTLLMDGDNDCDVDLVDYQIMQLNITGP